MSDEEYDSDIDVEAARPTKRFKFQSYQKSLRGVHLPPALDQKTLGQDIGDQESYFHEALDRWRELNLSPAFVQFARQTATLSASLPLLLHHWKDVVEAWETAISVADDEAMKPLLDLLQKLTHDLRSTLSPKYSEVLSRLVTLLPRSLSATSFSALLETLSALFKYLLIPSSDELLVESTWSQLRDIIPKANTEVQRAVAEVWGSVLRRLKLASREKAVRSLAFHLEGVSDPAAWAMVFACKSISQTLHTASASLLKPVFDLYLETEAPESTLLLLRRVMTALIHHCKSCVEFTPIGDLLVANLKREIDGSASEHKCRRVCRSLELVFVPCAVRQGSRLSQDAIMTVLEQCLSVEYDAGLHTALLRVVSAGLYAGQMPIWTGVGRRVLEHACKLHPRLGVELFGTLSDIGWRGWGMIGAPLLLRRTPEGLDREPALMLRLLAKLHQAKKLGEVDQVWKERTGKWVANELAHWVQTEEQVLRLQDVSVILPLLSHLEPAIVQIVEQTLHCDNVELDYASSFGNAGAVLECCLRALAQAAPNTWHAHVDLSSWTHTIIRKWASNPVVMESLVTLIESKHAQKLVLRHDDLYPHLRMSLLSHQQKLRALVLRLLASKVVQKHSATDMVKSLLVAEDVSLDVQGVRERLLRMNRLVQNVPINGEADAEICTRWLTAQLKVNLRPLWTPAAEALSRVAASHGDTVWSLAFAELQEAVHPKPLDQPTWLEESSDPADQDGIFEEERTWRDPTAHKFLSFTASWRSNDARKSELIDRQKSRDRFDSASYESQLIATMGVIHLLAEKHGRELIPFFLSLADSDTELPLPRHKLTMWLNLFAKFTNPKALYATDRMLALHMSLLSHPDKALQSAALSCFLTYKPPHVYPHEDTLRSLLDETRWRDALAALDLDELPSQDRTDMVDVVIRLLYGVMLERRGQGRGADRRTAILSALAAGTSEELRLLVGLMIRSFEEHAEGTGWTPVLVPSTVSHKQQTGFLHLLADVIRNLGPHIVSEWHRLLSATLDIGAGAQRLINQIGSPETAEEEEDEEEGKGDQASSKGIRTIRQLSVKRITDFFANHASFDFSPYLPGLFEYIVSPRLEVFDRENTQAPSALMDLFHVWAQDAKYAMYLHHYDATVLPRIFDCLNATNVKPSVIARIFDILESIIGFAEVDQTIAQQLLVPNVEPLLANLVKMVERTKGSDFANGQLGQRQLGILSRVANYVQDEAQATTLLSLLLPMLPKSHKVVSDRIKADILVVIRELLPLVTAVRDVSSSIYDQTYRSFAQLFQSIRARQGRVALIAAFTGLAELNPAIADIAVLLADLNAYSPKRMDEPDFDRRLRAFADLNGRIHKSLSAEAWLPLLFNMFYFIQDANELAVRSSASVSLRQFIDRVASEGGLFEQMFLRTLYPSLKNGLRTKHEMVRAEVLGVIAHGIRHCAQINYLQEMRGLLADGDEEANFFNNILHVQLHRRTRALRRLAEYSDLGHLRNATMVEVFVPLVENFITGPNETNHHLVNEAILTLSRLAKHLSWGSYYALVQSYLRISKEKKEKEGAERIHVRTLVAILDSFHFSMAEPAEEDATSDPAENASVTAAHVQKVSDAVNGRLLPALLRHLENREGAEENVRLPIAIGIIQICLHLPEPNRSAQISRLLTAVSQILRSKSQETRDLVRDTLRRVAVLLGSSHLPTILKELRTALTRGPQLHVLAFSIHNILAFVTAPEHTASFSNLDACVTNAVHVSAEVVFGESGKDVQSEDFKTTMKEVRTASSKGMDTFAILAQHVHASHISGLLQPLRAILQETSSQKALNTVDEVLRRIAGGLNTNEFLQAEDLLPLCHTLISQNARFLQEAPVQKAKTKTGKVHNVTVQLKRKIVGEDNYYTSNSFRFITFGLDLFNTAYRRGRFDFKNVQIVARLEPMVAVIGNTLYSDNAQVTVHALKAAVGITKCPLKAIEKSLPVYVRQMMKILEHSGNTESDVAQASLKSLAAIIRDCPSSEFREKDLVRLLELITPDMEETSRQSSVFAMLRAIVSRKFVVPEIYDVMDRVAEIMVTNQSSQVQETCRAILLQFLLDYPQGKGRLTNQITFLVKNLSYVHESGRKSVMEILGALISKFNPALLYQHAELLFVALVMSLANDESTKCREMSATLVQSLFARLDEERRSGVLAHLRAWSEQRDQPRLCSVSAQVYGLFLDAFHSEAADQRQTILRTVNGLLEAFSSPPEHTEEDAVEVEWRASYQALLTASKLGRDFPDVLTEPQSIAWDAVLDSLLFPHAWVRLAAARLVGQAFAITPAASFDSFESAKTLFSGQQARRIAQDSCEQLKSEHLDQTLGLQIVKNLFYLGKCFATLPLPLRPSDGESGPGEEDEEEVSDDEDQPKERGESHPLPWLFSRLSYQLRSSLIARRGRGTHRNWNQQPAAIMRWFAAMVSHLPNEDNERFLVHILTPVYHLLEDDTASDPQIDELRTTAVELQELLQSKAGSAQFADVYNRIRQGVLGVRRERRTNRVLMMSTRPDAAAKRKQHKNVNKKESRKRKSVVLGEKHGKFSRKRSRND